MKSKFFALVMLLCFGCASPEPKAFYSDRPQRNTDFETGNPPGPLTRYNQPYSMTDYYKFQPYFPDNWPAGEKLYKSDRLGNYMVIVSRGPSNKSGYGYIEIQALACSKLKVPTFLQFEDERRDDHLYQGQGYWAQPFKLKGRRAVRYVFPGNKFVTMPDQKDPVMQVGTEIETLDVVVMVEGRDFFYEFALRGDAQDHVHFQDLFERFLDKLELK